MSFNQQIGYNSNKPNNINKNDTITSEQKRQIVDDLFSSGIKDSQLSIQSNEKNSNLLNKDYTHNNNILNPIINNQENKYINNIINNDINNNFNENNNYNNYNNIDDNFNINNHINQQNFNNFNTNLGNNINNNNNKNEPVKLIDYSFTGKSGNSIFSNNQKNEGNKKEDDIFLDLKDVKFTESFKNQNNDLNSQEKNSIYEKEINNNSSENMEYLTGIKSNSSQDIKKENDEIDALFGINDEIEMKEEMKCDKKEVKIFVCSSFFLLLMLLIC